MVFVFGTQMDLVTFSSNSADDGTVTDATSGFSNCGTSTQEVKIDEKGCKFEKDSAAAAMSSVTFRLCVESIMTAGDNSLYAYTDGNSVTTTANETFGSDLSAGDNDYSIAQAFLDEITVSSGFFTLRVVSVDGSKNKIGSMEIEYTIPLIDIDGITKDDDDNLVTSRGVVLFRRTGGSSPYTWTQIDSATSNGTTGAYQFSYEDDGSEYRVFAQNTDGTKSDITPEIQGV